MVVTRDANDQGAGTSVRCRCSCCSLAVAMRNKALEHSYNHQLDVMEVQDVLPVQAGRLTPLSWLVLGAHGGGGVGRTSCAASPTLLRPFTQSPHRARPRPSLCGSSYIHTPTLYYYHQLTCDHLRYTPVACIQEPHVARPA